MATASRTQSAAKSRRPGQKAAPTAGGGTAEWLPPAIAAGIVAIAIVLGQTGVLPIEPTLAVAIVGILAALVLLGIAPALGGSAAGGERSTAYAFAAAWVALCAAPALVRVYPGTPLVAAAPVSGPQARLPMRIPTGGGGLVDLVFEGQLAEAGTGAAIPVRYDATIDGADTPLVVSGQFTEHLKTQRLGRRGTTVVHQQHVSELHTVRAAGDALTVTAVTVEPATAPPVSLTAFPHRLPAWPVAAAIAAALLGGAIWIDRLPGFAASDGTLTLATGGVLGALYFFTTDNAVHPGFGSLTGAAIFGGAVGLAVTAVVWWVVKRVAPVAR